MDRGRFVKFEGKAETLCLVFLSSLVQPKSSKSLKHALSQSSTICAWNLPFLLSAQGPTSSLCIKSLMQVEGTCFISEENGSVLRDVPNTITKSHFEKSLSFDLMNSYGKLSPNKTTFGFIYCSQWSHTISSLRINWSKKTRAHKFRKKKQINSTMT